jgi:pyruvate dehydrogenase E1 component
LAPEGRRLAAPAVPVPAAFPTPKVPAGRKLSTQQAFGEVLAEIGRGGEGRRSWPRASSPPART